MRVQKALGLPLADLGPLGFVSLGEGWLREVVSEAQLILDRMRKADLHLTYTDAHCAGLT